MSPAGFEPVIRKSKRPQTHALDRWATETGDVLRTDSNILTKFTILAFGKKQIYLYHFEDK